MWNGIIKSIIVAIFARKVLWPVVVFLILTWVVIGLPIVSGFVDTYRDYQGTCVQTSFNNCNGR